MSTTTTGIKKGTEVKVNLAAGHRQFQFHGRDGVVIGANRNGSIAVQFASGSIWAFQPSELIEAAITLPAGVGGATVTWRYSHPEHVGTVSLDGQTVGHVQVSATNGKATYGRNRRSASSPAAALLKLLGDYQEAAASTRSAAAAMGCPC
jgi:hypothetical protein